MYKEINRQFHEAVLSDEHQEARIINQYYDENRWLGFGNQLALDKAIEDTHLDLTNDEDYSSLYGYETIRAAKRWCTFRGIFLEYLVEKFVCESPFGEENFDDVDEVVISHQGFEDLLERGDDVVITTFEKLEALRETKGRQGLIMYDPLHDEVEIAMETAREIFDNLLEPLTLPATILTQFTFQSPEDGQNTCLIRQKEGQVSRYALINFENTDGASVQGEICLLLVDGNHKAFDFIIDGKEAGPDTQKLLTKISLLNNRVQASKWAIRDKDG
jgi:hypothetical protein